MAGKSPRLTLSPAHLLSTVGPLLARGDLAVHSWQDGAAGSPFYCFPWIVRNISLSQESQSLKFNQIRFNLSMDVAITQDAQYHVDDSMILSCDKMSRKIVIPWVGCHTQDAGRKHEGIKAI